MKQKDYTLEEIEAMIGSGDLGHFVEDKDVRDILEHEVAEEMQKILLKHIMSDIYSYALVVTPISKLAKKDGSVPAYRILPGWINTGSGFKYGRRNTLSDPGNIYKEIIGGDTLFMTSDATPNVSTIGQGWAAAGHGAFLEMIGTNPGRMWPYRHARPAIQGAQAEVDSSGAVEAAFERGLKRLGYT